MFKYLSLGLLSKVHILQLLEISQGCPWTHQMQWFIHRRMNKLVAFYKNLPLFQCFDIHPIRTLYWLSGPDTPCSFLLLPLSSLHANSVLPQYLSNAGFFLSSRSDAPKWISCLDEDNTILNDSLLLCSPGPALTFSTLYPVLIWLYKTCIWLSHFSA